MKTDKNKRGTAAKVMIGSIVLAAAIVAGSLIGNAGKDNTGALSPSFAGRGAKPKVDIKVLEAEYRSDVAAAFASYKSAVEVAGHRFSKALEGECGDAYAAAGATIHQTAKQFGSFNRAAKVVALIAEDKIRKTTKLDAFLQDELGTGYITPCLEANAKVEARYADYCGELAALANKLQTELVADADKFNAKLPSPQSLDSMKFDVEQIGSVATKVIGARVSVVVAGGFEAAFIGPTVRAVASLGAKAAAKLGFSAIAPAADGPLPIGDIIAVGGLIWTGIDFCRFKVKLPAELEKSMRESLEAQKSATLRQARGNAAELEKEYLALGEQMKAAALLIVNEE